MKSLVVGAMLLRTMNAQIAAGNALPVVSRLPVKDTLAPVLTPGIDAPSESELLGPAANIVPLIPEPSFSLPIGTADVVLPSSTGLNLFGVGTKPASVSNVIAPVQPAPVAGSGAGSGGFGAFAAPDSPDAIQPAPEAPVAPEETSILVDSPIMTPVLVSAPSETPSPLPVGAVLPVGSNPYNGPYDPNSIYDPTSPYYDPYAKPLGWEGDDNGYYDGEDEYYPGRKSGGKYDNEDKYDDEDKCPSWCQDKNKYDDSYDDKSDYNPSKSEYKKKPDYGYEKDDDKYPQLKKVRSIIRAVRRQVATWGQPAYTGDDDDTGSYDGEDGSIPDWLYEISGAPKKPTATPKAKCPKSCYKSKDKDQGYGSKPVRPTYTKTRKGGYKTESPYKTEDPYKPEDPYKTEDPYKPEDPYKTDDYYTTSADMYKPTGAPYDDYSSSAWYPQSNSSGYYWSTGTGTGSPDLPTSIPDLPTSIPDEPTSDSDGSTSIPSNFTSVPSEPTNAYYEPTTLMTQYQPQPYPAETGYASSDPGSPAGDYTGDTLDTLCPNTCNPFNPAQNFCDISTGCTTTGGSKYYCACRAGFRADDYNAKDFSKQFKVAGQPYVYLAVHTTCNTPCSDQTCSEVLERSQCM